jgi:anti-sigma B factor antagonist
MGWGMIQFLPLRSSGPFVGGMFMIHLEKNNGISLLKISGNLEIKLSMELEEVINTQIAEGEKLFVIDLGDVQYLSSSGIRVFVATLRQLDKLNGRLALANISENAKKTMKLVDVASVFSIFRSVEDAFKALKPD